MRKFPTVIYLNFHLFLLVFTACLDSRGGLIRLETRRFCTRISLGFRCWCKSVYDRIPGGALHSDYTRNPVFAESRSSSSYTRISVISAFLSEHAAFGLHSDPSVRHRIALFRTILSDSSDRLRHSTKRYTRPSKSRIHIWTLTDGWCITLADPPTVSP